MGDWDGQVGGGSIHGVLSPCLTCLKTDHDRVQGLLLDAQGEDPSQVIGAQLWVFVKNSEW